MKVLLNFLKKNLLTNALKAPVNRTLFFIHLSILTISMGMNQISRNRA